MALKVVMLGDIVGKPGKRVVHQCLAAIRKDHQPDLVTPISRVITSSP